MNDRAQAVLDFWFDEMVAEKRFKKDKSFDDLIKEKFGEDHNKAINNEYDDWQDHPSSCLALVILLDQFSSWKIGLIKLPMLDNLMGGLASHHIHYLLLYCDLLQIFL